MHYFVMQKRQDIALTGIGSNDPFAYDKGIYWLVKEDWMICDCFTIC